MSSYTVAFSSAQALRSRNEKLRGSQQCHGWNVVVTSTILDDTSKYGCFIMLGTVGYLRSVCLPCLAGQRILGSIRRMRQDIRPVQPEIHERNEMLFMALVPVCRLSNFKHKRHCTVVILFFLHHRRQERSMMLINIKLR